MAYAHPELNALLKMLEMIIGPDAGASDAEGLEHAQISHTAIYVDKDNTPVASCSCDLKTAAALGCSLSMIPPGGAEAMVEDGELTNNATDNLYEVMNIFSSLLMSDRSSHLKLSTLNVGAETPVAGESIKDVCFNLDLGNYGVGTIMFNAV